MLRQGQLFCSALLKNGPMDLSSLPSLAHQRHEALWNKPAPDSRPPQTHLHCVAVHGPLRLQPLLHVFPLRQRDGRVVCLGHK